MTALKNIKDDVGDNDPVIAKMIDVVMVMTVVIVVAMIK